MKLTRFQIINIVGILEKIVEIGSNSITFKYVSKKIRELLKSETEAIKEVKPVKLIEYQNKLAEIHKELATKDDGGKYKFVDGATPDVNGNLSIFQLEIKDRVELDNRISEINKLINAKEIENENNDITKFMNEEIEVNIPKIKLSQLPLELTDKDMEILFEIIEEE